MTYFICIFNSSLHNCLICKQDWVNTECILEINKLCLKAARFILFTIMVLYQKPIVFNSKLNYKFMSKTVGLYLVVIIHKFKIFTWIRAVVVRSSARVNIKTNSNQKTSRSANQIQKRAKGHVFCMEAPLIFFI